MDLNRNQIPTLQYLLILTVLWAHSECKFLCTSDTVNVPQHRTTEPVYVMASKRQEISSCRLYYQFLLSLVIGGIWDPYSRFYVY